MAINKVIYDGDVLIDLTNDTVDAAHLLQGYIAHTKSGSTVAGSCTYDADTSTGTAGAAEILASKIAFASATQPSAYLAISSRYSLMIPRLTRSTRSMFPDVAYSATA